MKFTIKVLTLALALTSSFAAHAADGDKATCTILSEINQVSQPEKTLVVDLAGIDNCGSKTGQMMVPNSKLKLEVVVAGTCVREFGSYPQHLTGPSLTGPKNSGVYARAFAIDGEYSSKRSLQLTANVNGVKNNVIVHCKIAQ